MCGIAGFCGRGDRADLSRMTQSLAHRGPDGEGFYIDEDDPVFLGHRRLSIIDLLGGTQPMTNETGEVWITFNGEIYNHRELRQELEQHGHHFATVDSDTEVLVHGWEEWGTELPGKLNGMFAFCIFDKRSRQLFLARDRFGEKPLFWGQQGDLFLFGSELCAFSQHSLFHADVDRFALKKYFAYSFLPAPYSSLKDVWKLKQGHWLVYDIHSGSVNTKPYYEFRITPLESPPSFDEAAEEIEHLFIQSVQRRLMSDVPLGVFLSGGIDSSSVASAMCSLAGASNVQSFAIGFHEKSFNESHHASAMAAHLGCNHHERIADLQTAHSIVDHLLGKLHEPLGDGSILPTYILSKFTREHVTVALGGDAGDELFAGYDPFKALLPARIYHTVVSQGAHKTIKRLVDMLPKSHKNMSLDFKLRRVLQGLDYDDKLWNPVWMAPLTQGEIEDLFNAPITAEELYDEAITLWTEDKNKSHTDKTLEYFTNFYLPDDILTKVDRASMLNSLEARAVFLDNDLTEFVRTLPASYKYDGWESKKVLKAAMKRLVPKEIRNRSKKGFGIPLMHWLKQLPLDSAHAENFGMRPQLIDNMIRSHQKENQDHRLGLWAWKALQQSLSWTAEQATPGNG